jgi:aryl-alcohol dehydrogenase-like predicted oxidoreductase
MPYGVVNDSGQPAEETAVAIIRHAIALGVTSFDTAREYGRSEVIIGRALADTPGSAVKVITKLGISTLSKHATQREVDRGVDESVEQSCQALQSENLDVLLLHRWEHRHAWRGAAWTRLEHLEKQGQIKALGASLYEPWDVIEALRDECIGHLQIPVNVLDWRWRDSRVQAAIKERPDVTVHARSVLLQGILAHSADRWPAAEFFDRFQCAQVLRDLAKKFGRETVTDLCFAYVRALGWIDALAVGCETMKQLDENLRIFSRPPLTPEQCEELERGVPNVPEDFLNPSKWSISHEPSVVAAN